MPKRVAIRIPKPRQPLRNMLVIIDPGTVRDGSAISSDILNIISAMAKMADIPGLLTWTAASAPSVISAIRLLETESALGGAIMLTEKRD